MIIPGKTVVIPGKTQVIPGITQQKQGFLLQKQGFLLQKTGAAMSEPKEQDFLNHPPRSELPPSAAYRRRLQPYTPINRFF